MDKRTTYLMRDAAVAKIAAVIGGFTYERTNRPLEQDFALLLDRLSERVVTTIAQKDAKIADLQAQLTTLQSKSKPKAKTNGTDTIPA